MKKIGLDVGDKTIGVAVSDPLPVSYTHLAKFRENFRGHLDRIKFVEDMSEEELKEYNKKHKKNS